MRSRIIFFLIYLLKTIFTFGIYPLYFHITRQQESNELLKEILNKVKG